MPRGKRKVIAYYCKNDNKRVATMRFHSQNSKGVSWKDNKFMKYCPTCMKHVELKGKEEKHSS